VALLLVLSACGAPTDGPPPGSPDGITGEIYVSGSSTVEPVSQAVSEAFRERNPGFGYTVEGPGTGDGFAAFCDGNTDVSGASRPIRETEIQACADNGVEYVELRIAYDGIAVVTHRDTPVECLNHTDLYALFGPEADHVNTWREAEALTRQLGSDTGFPDMRLQITAPGEESGTYDSFLELALHDLIEERGTDEALRVPGPHYTASPNDNVIIEGVEAGPGSLGFVGYAFYAEAGQAVKAIEVDGGEGCVAPTPETIADGRYSLSRPLYIYPSVQRAADNAALSAWVEFYLSEDGMDSVAQTGYVPLPEADLAAEREAWDGR
jgi:phosphate transport system substrate-binding protein